MPLSQGLLKALRDRFLGRIVSAGGGDVEGATLAQSLPRHLGPYRVKRKLGQGGMGIVYEAHDDKLDRSLAVKVIAADAADDTTIRRFQREARAAAAVNHPNVCQLYELGEHEGALFIAMELLEGEPLSERLRRGALPLLEALPIAFGMLSALQALHARGLVHRDLKPSNVFLTPHGVKLLDFGLARKGLSADSLTGTLSGPSELTRPGMILGTPRYMAPEQVRGEEVDARTDLFAVGAILFEMLAGRPIFAGATAVEVFYATLHEQPPALTGSPAVLAADRAIRKALQKKPADRPASAEALLIELKAIALDRGEAQAETRARTLTRLVVLPFRMLRPDPDTDFLSLGLADAVSTSLSGVRSVVVRSSTSASRFAAQEHPDLRRIAAEADVDLVLLGTLLRSGERLRATAQLVEAPAGTLLGAHTVEAAVGDVFRLQDELTARIVESLALPLQGRAEDSTLASRRRAPLSPRAYELYLRGNHASLVYEQMPVARDLYLQALDEDPMYAPAWARLGRAHRLIGKYIEDADGNRLRAEAAFRRALELDPDLSIAHKLYAHFEAEWGRAPQAMVRLLERARRQREDAELFAGLVHACRYCGLFEASMAAHDEARRLDPHVPTSAAYTLFLMGDYERLARSGDTILDYEPQALGLLAQGRREEALRRLDGLAETQLPRVFRMVAETMQACLSGRVPDTAKMEEATRAHTDPEALYMFSIFQVELGRTGRALELLKEGVGRGFAVAPALRRDPLLEPLRVEAGFAELVAAAESARQEAHAAFARAGGRELLGI